LGIDRKQGNWGIAAGAVAVLLILTLVFYRDTAWYLVKLWSQGGEGEYAHGFLVLAISLYLILRNRRELLQSAPCPNYLALLAVGGSGLLLTASVLADVQAAQALSMLFLVLALVWAVFGNRITRGLLFPIVYLIFAIPVWFPLAPFLQEITANAVFALVRYIGVPAFRQEQLIMLPSGQFVIAEACAGLRFLLAALTLGTLYAYLNYTTLVARSIVILISAAAAVLVNIVRVFIIVYLGYSTEMQHPWVEDHLGLGWMLFGGLLFLLLGLDYKLNRPVRKSPVPVSETGGKAGFVACKHAAVRMVTTTFVSVMVLASGAAVTFRVNSLPDKGAVEAAYFRLPTGPGTWSGPIESAVDWMPLYHGSVARKQAYRKDNNTVYLYVGYYPEQRQGRELINDLNRISGEGAWKAVYPRAQLHNVGEQRVLEQVIEKGADRQLLIWYWYSLAGKTVTNKYLAKLLQLSGIASGQSQAAVIAIATEQSDEENQAHAVLEDFLMAIQAPVTHLIAEIPDQKVHSAWEKP
jgi:exosortase A